MKKHILKALSFVISILVLLSVLPLNAFAASLNVTSGKTGDCTWKLDGTVLTISGNGEMADYNYSGPWGNNITEVIINYGVKNIGNHSFDFCKKLTKVSIPRSVINIGYSAFSICSGLTTLTIPNGVRVIGERAFDSCENLVSVELPTSITSIGNYAFNNCSSFTSITIPDSVTSIGSGAFSWCPNLTSITIPDSVTSIGSETFNRCSSLVNITIPNSVTSIGDYAFGWCSSLVNITIPNSVTSIGNSAFKECTGLASITIPDSVTNIGDSAFERCSNLKSIIIPDSVTSIGNSAFKNCPYVCIYTTENSAAHKYAVNNNIRYYLTEILTKPSEPILLSLKVAEDSKIEVVLKVIGGYEYRCNNGEWQQNPTFEGLNFGCQYKFYQRLAESDKNTVGITSEPLTVRLKNLNNVVPGAPETTLVTFNSITLKRIEGYEYSKDGINWQKSNVFNGLEPNKTYTFYQRMEENDVFYESKSSLGVTVTTLKESPNTPDAPIIISRTNSSVTLQPIDGYEYKMDNGEWQESNIFSNVEPNKIHIFYQRFAETDTAYAGESSPGKEVYTFVCFIAYNANGGTGAPEIQEFLSDSGTISDIVPQRDGYSFFGWNMLDDFITIYQPGDTIDMTRDLTLYAMWAKKCESCNATGKIQVKNTSKCSACEGDGVRTKCSRCGSYNVTYHIQGGGLPKYWQCNACKSVNSVTGVSCISCNGTGIYVSYHTEMCNECYGSGHPDEISPVIIQFTDTKVVLQAKSGYEYSQDGIHFQESNVFENLLPATTYSFYQRKAQIGSCPFGVVGPSIKITTDKSQSVAIPSAPTIENVTADTIVLKYIQGYEYSKDGNKWDSSPKFTGLSPATEYTFYQRVAATNTSYAGKTSPGAKFKTDKGICKAPSEPVLQSKTHNTVILQPVAGCEYSMDGITWQTSNQFTGLDAQTNYFFYQRYAESDRYYASPSSKGLTVRTDGTPKYVTGDLDGNNEVTDADAEYLLMHTFFPEEYPINQNCDFNDDGAVTDADAEYLLMFTFFPEEYPIN